VKLRPATGPLDVQRKNFGSGTLKSQELCERAEKLTVESVTVERLTVEKPATASDAVATAPRMNARRMAPARVGRVALSHVGLASVWAWESMGPGLRWKPVVVGMAM
jgi:hypothetical protein